MDTLSEEKPTRRRFLKGAATTFTAALAGCVGRLPEIPFTTPTTMEADTQRRYKAATLALNIAILECADEVSRIRNEYGIKDIKDALGGMELTIIPRHQQQEGVVYFNFKTLPYQRKIIHTGPKLLAACQDMAMLDDEFKNTNPRPDPLNYDNLAAKLVNAYQDLGKDPLVNSNTAKNKCSVLLKTATQALMNTFRPEQAEFPDVARNAAVAEEFVMKARYVLGSIGLGKLSHDIYLDVRVKNPLLRQNQEEAKLIRREEKDPRKQQARR